MATSTGHRNRSRFRRVLIKLSGEALMGEQDYGIAPSVIRHVAAEVKALATAEIEVAMVGEIDLNSLADDSYLSSVGISYSV